MNAFDRARATVARTDALRREERAVTQSHLANLAERVRSTHRAYLARPTSTYREERFGQVLAEYRSALVTDGGLDRRAVPQHALMIALGRSTVAEANRMISSPITDLGLDDIVPRTLTTSVHAEDGKVLILSAEPGRHQEMDVLTEETAVTLMQGLADALGFDLRKK